MIGYAANCIIKCVIMNKKYVKKGIFMDVIAGSSIGIKLVNGKIRPKKRSIKTNIVIIIFIILLVIFFLLLLYGFIHMKMEYILYGGITVWGASYVLLISAYTQSSKNYYIKVHKEDSFEGFELYYKKKKVELLFQVDEEGKFKWANNHSKLKCISYSDGTSMHNFTKYRIINYFSAWLLENDYLSKEATVTFEEL